jgi:hypothetical protein
MDEPSSMDLVVDGLLDLGGGNGHVLELAENIG